MANDVGHKLLYSLKDVDWQVAGRVYGNDHSTLIGLIVRWWVSQCPERRWAMDGGATCRPGRGKRPWHSDALLGEDDRPAGILEVEGTRIAHAIAKLRTFLGAEDRELQRLKFAILLTYPEEPKGRGERRGFPAAFPETHRRSLKQLSGHFPQKSILLITVEKAYKKDLQGIRSRNEYHRGTASRVVGTLYEAKEATDKVTYWPSA